VEELKLEKLVKNSVHIKYKIRWMLPT